VLRRLSTYATTTNIINIEKIKRHADRTHAPSIERVKQSQIQHDKTYCTNCYVYIEQQAYKLTVKWVNYIKLYEDILQSHTGTVLD